MRLLLQEIAEKREQLYQSASLKERLFLDYLETRSDLRPHEQPKGDIDEICLAAFSRSRPTEAILQSIEKHRSLPVVKGIHFSTSLITVAAFSVFSSEVRLSELKRFLETALEKERFVLSRMFTDHPYIDVHEDPVLRNIPPIIRIALGEELPNEADTIADAITESVDLVDIHLVSLAYEKILQRHPSSQLAREALRLVEQNNDLLSTVTTRVRRLVRIGSIGVLLGFPVALSILIVTQWENLGLEPYIVAGSLIWSTVVGLLAVLVWSNPEFSWTIFIQSKLERIVRMVVEYWFLHNGVTFDFLEHSISKVRTACHEIVSSEFNEEDLEIEPPRELNP